jgi:radical SAM superfamily enzyme YgiQ (UPF0313 family)
MKVLLISSNTERINMITIPLGLGLVAAATRAAGHEVIFLDLLNERKPEAAVRRAVKAARPDVVGISVRNIDDQSRDAPRFLLEEVKPVVDACRSSTSAPIVLGGAGYSIFPDAAIAYLGADFGVSGDGEAVFPALLERLQLGGNPAGLPGVRLASSPGGAGPAFHDDLDAFPLWDQTLSESADPAAADLWIPVQTRRGCPNDCAYCSTAAIQGRKIRARSPREAVEVVALLAHAGYRRFYFVDNSFNIPEHHALQICRWMKALAPDAQWRCILYPHVVGEALVRAMAEAGCVEVSLGFESGCERILRELHKRFTPDDVRRTSDLLAAHGIRRMGFLLLGGPGEDRGTVEESLAFAESLNLDALKITVGIRIYPNTPLARRAVEERMISAEDTLLHPSFYLAPGLEPWIQERVGRFEAAHPQLSW